MITNSLCDSVAEVVGGHPSLMRKMEQTLVHVERLSNGGRTMFSLPYGGDDQQQQQQPSKDQKDKQKPKTKKERKSKPKTPKKAVQPKRSAPRSRKNTATTKVLVRS